MILEGSESRICSMMICKRKWDSVVPEQFILLNDEADDQK